MIDIFFIFLIYIYMETSSIVFLILYVLLLFPSRFISMVVLALDQSSQKPSQTSTLLIITLMTGVLAGLMILPIYIIFLIFSSLFGSS
mgnify:CR=1 FL=1